MTARSNDKSRKGGAGDTILLIGVGIFALGGRWRPGSWSPWDWRS